MSGLQFDHIETQERHSGLIRVHRDLIQHLFMLPKEYTVSAIYVDTFTGELRIHVEHPDLPVVQEGHFPADVTIMVQSKVDADGREWISYTDMLTEDSERKRDTEPSLPPVFQDAKPPVEEGPQSLQDFIDNPPDRFIANLMRKISLASRRRFNDGSSRSGI